MVGWDQQRGEDFCNALHDRQKPLLLVALIMEKAEPEKIDAVKKAKREARAGGRTFPMEGVIESDRSPGTIGIMVDGKWVWDCRAGAVNSEMFMGNRMKPVFAAGRAPCMVPRSMPPLGTLEQITGVVAEAVQNVRFASQTHYRSCFRVKAFVWPVQSADEEVPRAGSTVPALISQLPAEFIFTQRPYAIFVRFVKVESLGPTAPARLLGFQITPSASSQGHAQIEWIKAPITCSELHSVI
jgi:hypothetical protein